MVQKMATTFRALADLANWDAVDASTIEPRVSEAPDHETLQRTVPLRLHHDVHVHLPPTSDMTVYTAIFRALREELLD